MRQARLWHNAGFPPTRGSRSAKNVSGTDPGHDCSALLPEKPAMMDALSRVVTEVIEPNALTLDRDGTFPRAAMDALGKAGLLGLLSAKGMGGLGENLRAAV